MSVLNFVQNKFDSFRNYQVVYVYKANPTNINIIFYRIGLQTKFGAYYEIIISIPRGSSDLYLIKYEKLFDGYYFSLDGNNEAKKAV